ncbi:MAG: glycosyltransferase family 39 protein, partial [Candidatus Levybacteria bacterium]|nr:glycosyltransferase family 39 protein [Candidatus Levybacteria bacterium]
MINKRLLLILISVIIVIAAVLRIYQLGNVPPSPDWDEVALGYDAYSIMQTGKDEFGKFLPVVLRSFDDYKPALYAYLIIPAISLFDLSVFAVRFPSAVFGVISVIAVFFLTREIFEKHKYRDYISLVSAFLMAISPWSLQFSRVGFESNVAGSFNILTVLFFVKAIKKPWLFILSAVFAGLSIYIYQSEKVFTPLLVITLLLIFRKEIFALSKKYIL